MGRFEATHRVLKQLFTEDQYTWSQLRITLCMMTACRKESLCIGKVVCERFSPSVFLPAFKFKRTSTFENSTQTSRVRAPTVRHRGFCSLAVDHDQHTDAMICSAQGPVPR